MAVKKSRCIDCGVVIAFAATRCHNCLEKVKKTCRHCGNKLKKGDRGLCSEQCRVAYFKENKAEAWCETCGKPMIASTINGGKYKTCSDECRDKRMKKNMSWHNKGRHEKGNGKNTDLDNLCEQERLCGNEELSKKMRLCKTVEEAKKLRAEYHNGGCSIKMSTLMGG